MLNRKDPLIESVQKIMKENEVRRRVTSELNEELGIQSVKNLPHELHEKYNAVLEQNITAALLGEKVEMTKKQFANLDGKPEFTGRDLELVRQGHHKVKAAAGKLEEAGVDPKGGDTTSPSSMGIKKPDYATGTPDYAKNKEQTVNRAEKKSLPPGTIKEDQLEEASTIATKKAMKGTKYKLQRSNADKDGSVITLRQGKRVIDTGDYDVHAGATFMGKGTYRSPKDILKTVKEEQNLQEKITSKTDMGSAIKDFEGSKSKQLAGRSKEDRRKAAIAAVLQARREKK